MGVFGSNMEGRQIAKTSETTACKKALSNAVAAVNSSLMFPENIFAKRIWGTYLFFSSDIIFSESFIDIVQSFLRAEKAEAACLVNLDRLQEGTSEQNATMCVGLRTTSEDYQARLREGTPGQAWLFNMERYICTSDAGGWCIYCEKGSDFAVVALRDRASLGVLKHPLSLLRAAPLKTIYAKYESRMQLSSAAAEWRDNLARNYKLDAGFS
jgi:hypothetical protein